MDAQLCKKFIKILPHAAALLTTNASNGYELVECNQIFCSMFGIAKANIPDVISAKLVFKHGCVVIYHFSC